MLNLSLFSIAILLVLTAGTAQRVRLVGGNSRQGRLEVYYNNVWGTVCDDNFDDAAARVVCNMLGYGYFGRFLNNHYGAGSGTIWLDNVQCSGIETNIANCQHNSWGSHDCSHSEDVSVSCITARLVGSGNPREGRLEVYHNNAWGTVCDDYFNDAAARVVCNMLGYGYFGRFLNNHYGAGSGTIWLDNVQCSGTETNIANCQHNSWGSHDCVHGEDVSLSCVAVRLVGSGNPQEGRLEVYYNSIWGTVCDDGFTDTAANVVCNMLGYGYYGRFLNNYYGAGDGTIWLDQVQCSGTETNIANCQHNSWGSHDCSHSEDVSVKCITVRLVGSGSPREGRLEVSYNGIWGTVCDDFFTAAAAKVVCYMLGYINAGYVINNRYGAGSGTIWLDNVQCSGTETNIANCQHNSWGSHNCGHSEDVSVSCITARLVGSGNPQEGRLEVYHNGVWGTVCDDGFTDTAARVVCNMLLYQQGGKFIGNRYGAGVGTIWLDDVQCRGTEVSITNCQHRGWGRHNCDHNNDVSVSCFNEVRLSGNSGSKGRLEVYHNGIWGTVCDNGFTDTEARVVCYYLGYGHTGRFIGNHYSAVSGRIWLDNVRCFGSESHITKCRYNNWGRHNCQHSEDVSISCISDSAEAVALVGGENPRMGRLEVFHANQWGTVCDDGFTDTAATVVCYSLGFGYVGRKVNISHYGIGNGLIWLSNINCNGTEQYISECAHGDWTGQNSHCGHHEDVAISCTDNSTESNANDSTTSVTPVRLAGGSGSRGRLEVFHDGVWGTVCEDLFTAATAHVFCKMLRLGPGTKIDNSNYTISHGPIWLDNVHCNGTEEDIAQCSHKGWGIHNCQHHEDVAISCALSKVEVRLNGGRDPRIGRLEVFHNGTWGSVCHDEFNSAAARIVCNMLGFGYLGRPTTNNYGAGTGPFWLTSVRCSGTEKRITECAHDGWGLGSCQRGEEQAVSCLIDDAVALFGGRNPREGRLEVYRNGTWGTVCDDGFTDATARVICYSLGFGYIGEEMNINVYGIGEGQIWLDDVHCDGTERHISECSHRGWGVHDCAHKEDVAVSCFGESLVSSTTTTGQSATILTAHSMITSSPSTSSTSSFTTSTQSRIIHHATNNSKIIIAAVVVGGFVICIIVVVVGLVVHFRQKQRRGRTEAAVNTIPTATSSNTFSNNAFDDTATTSNDDSNNNLYVNVQQSFPPVEGAVGGDGNKDVEYAEPPAMYEILAEDQGSSSRAQPLYETLNAR